MKKVKEIYHQLILSHSCLSDLIKRPIIITEHGSFKLLNIDRTRHHSTESIHLRFVKCSDKVCGKKVKLPKLIPAHYLITPFPTKDVRCVSSSNSGHHITLNYT